MNEQDVLHRLATLEQTNKRLGQWLKGLSVTWLITLPFLITAWTLPKATPVTAPTDSLRLNKLVIVDPQNRERIVIAAPLPDPIVKGKVAHRRDRVTAGIQFKDPNGTERGGIAALADSSFVVGIDDESGGERAHLYYLPKRGSGVHLQGEKETETVSLLVPVKGANPKLEMTDQTGRKTLLIPN
ncbi:hypothetical protein GCM10028805_58080 [Spirosoma harenae]